MRRPIDAWPSSPEVDFGAVGKPFVAAQVTSMPGTGCPAMSTILTMSGCGIPRLTTPVWLFPETILIDAGAERIAFAVNVAGVAAPVVVAVIVSVPTIAPSV